MAKIEPFSRQRSHSMSGFGDISITTSNQNYAPGSQVHGVIYLNLTENFPTSKIHLQLQGQEKIKWWDHKIQTSRPKGGESSKKREKIDVY
jgi:hypothetical protein